MKWSRLLFVPVCVALTSCSRLLDLTVFNNTSANITLLAGNEEIAPNSFGTVKFPGTGKVGKYSLVRIAGGGCEYLYDLEKASYPYDEAHPLMASERGIQVQVERDFSINLLPQTYEGKVPVSGDVVLSHEGFPLRPIAKKCG